MPARSMNDFGNLLDEVTLATGALLIVFSLAAFRRTRKFIANCRAAEGRITGYTTEEPRKACITTP
jgi:hypothetical protein